MPRLGKKPLPKFSVPPVIETVVGVEFRRLESWSVPYFGLFWKQIKDRFPKFAVKPPLASQIEIFEKPKAPPVPRLQFFTEPEIRCWFIDAADRALIQVQSNRFTYNWRKTEADDSYPHYDEWVRPSFEDAWKQFLDFVREQQLGDVEVLQCEVSYINHIEVDKGWHTAADLSTVFPCWSGKSRGEFLPAPEDVSFEVNYRLPDDRGRLRVSLSPAIRHKDGVEILQLTLTARGKPTDGTTAATLEWIDLGREWVVRGFADFTSANMHSLWKRTS
ncbi:MAG: TIGR04255 family protein [Planctomycetota bacterium]|nr:TIGR04255 family protein [Planctomycetota bacterium]